METNNEHKKQHFKKKLIVTKVYKRKTLVILTEGGYKRKTRNFRQDKQFIMINKNPTKQYQKIIKQTLRQCNDIIQRQHRWSRTDMNPIAPNLRAIIKLHKQNTPIRPIINLRNAPAYQLAKQLTKTLHNYLQLQYTYNIHLMTSLQTIKLRK
jgi:hypothetical protein